MDSRAQCAAAYASGGIAHTDKRVPSPISIAMAKITPKLARFSKYVLQDCDNEKDRTVTVRIPGPTFDSVNRAGGIAVWHVMRWFGVSFSIGNETRDPKTGTSFLDLVKLPRKRFLRVLNIIFEKDFHRLLGADEDPKLSIETCLSHIGNTSLTFVSILRDENTGKVLATCISKAVFIRAETDQPTPLPDWWKRKRAPAVVESQELVMPPLEVGLPTENAYKYTMKVTWNDTDFNNHVNNTKYVVFCFDAAMEAIKNHAYVGFHNDILSYDVKALKMSFSKECKAGDSLTIITWQDVHDPKILHFSIEKADEIIYQNSIEFFLKSYL